MNLLILCIRMGFLYPSRNFFSHCGIHPLHRFSIVQCVCVCASLPGHVPFNTLFTLECISVSTPIFLPCCFLSSHTKNNIEPNFPHYGEICHLHEETFFFFFF